MVALAHWQVIVSLVRSFVFSQRKGAKCYLPFLRKVRAYLWQRENMSGFESGMAEGFLLLPSSKVNGGGPGIRIELCWKLYRKRGALIPIQSFGNTTLIYSHTNGISFEGSLPRSLHCAE